MANWDNIKCEDFVWVNHLQEYKSSLKLKPKSQQIDWYKNQLAYEQTIPRVLLMVISL